jgi:hypothetical protein
MPNGINALMHPMKPTLRNAPLNPAVVYPDRQQLPPTDDAVLSARQDAKPHVGVWSRNLSL